MNNHIVSCEIIEADVDETEAHLYLRVELAEVRAGTTVRAWLTGPKGAREHPLMLATFEPLPPPEIEEDEEPEENCLYFEVRFEQPAQWSPRAPGRYEGEVELWDRLRYLDNAALHYSHYTLAWEENHLSLNDEPLKPRVRRVESLDEPTARRLIAEGVNVVILPASAVAAWELADRVGLLLLGELPEDGALPDDLAERSVRPCCLGWLVPSLETPLPEEPLPGLLGLRSDEPVDELPDELEFLLLEPAPELEPGEELGYPWIAVE